MCLCNCLCTDNTNVPPETPGDAAGQSNSAGGGNG
jgi:hypothetical protein